MDDERDEMIDRVSALLRPLPTVDESAKARVLVAVAAERERAREELLLRPWRNRRWKWVAAVGALAAAALLVTVFRAPTAPSAGAPTATLPSASSSGTRLAAHDAADLDAARQSIQFVFRAPAAARVRVVGDFNGWDKEQAPMTRDSASGLWSATLQLRTGRHIYAFVVDDTLWVRDPRAPAAPDADFGRPGSVLLVGHEN